MMKEWHKREQDNTVKEHAEYNMYTIQKKWSFPSRISSVNVTKSTGNCGFSHIYWRNPYGKLLLFVQQYQPNNDSASPSRYRHIL